MDISFECTFRRGTTAVERVFHCPVFQPCQPWLPGHRPAAPHSDPPHLAAAGNIANASAKKLWEPWSCRAAGQSHTVFSWCDPKLHQCARPLVTTLWFFFCLSSTGNLETVKVAHDCWTDELHQRNAETRRCGTTASADGLWGICRHRTVVFPAASAPQM